MSKLSDFLDKYKVYHLGLDHLHLDPRNPRLHEEDQNKSQIDIMKVMKDQFDLPELSYSIANNGYFQEEPIIAIPEKPELLEEFINDETSPEDFFNFVNENEIKFIVVEGNRRLSTVKLLSSEDLQSELKIKNWPIVKPKFRSTLKHLPVVVYPDRASVATYIGIRHIGGLKKWEPYEKARYVKSLIEEQGIDINDVQQMVGDKGNSIRKSYLCYILINIIETEFDLPKTVEKAKSRFSYLLLSLGQTSIKSYLGIEANYSQIDFKKPIREDKKDSLKDVFSWLFGEGPKIPAVINESRDITNYLSPVLKIPKSISLLKSTRDLIDAYELSDGEKELLIKYATKATSELGKIVALIKDELVDKAFIYQLEDIKTQVQKIEKLLPNKEE